MKPCGNLRKVSSLVVLLIGCAGFKSFTAQAAELPDPDAPIVVPVPAPDAYNAIIGQADGQLKQGQWAATLVSAQEAMLSDPARFSGYYYAAYALYRMDKIDEARNFLQMARARMPAASENDVNRLADAINKKRLALAQIKVGDLALDQGLLAKAAIAYTAAWDAVPTRQEIGLKAANLWSERLNNVVEAARILNYLAAHPSSPDTDKQVASAQQALQPALQKLFDKKMQQGQQLLEQKNLNEARRAFEIAAQAVPIQQEPHIQLARIQAQQRGVDNALIELSQVFKLGPATIDNIFNHPEFAALLSYPQFQNFLTDALGPDMASLARAKIAAAAASDPAAVFTNGDFSAGNDTPDGWHLLDANMTAKVQLLRDQQDFQMGPSSLRLDINGSPGAATIYQEFSALPTAPFVITGYTKAADKVDEIRIYVQFYTADWKLIDFIADQLALTPRWQQFAEAITLPQDTTHAVFFLQVKGQGKVWLDEVDAIPAVAGAKLATASAVPDEVVTQAANQTDATALANDRKQWLAAAGLPDKAIQSVLDYIAEQEKLRQSLDGATTALRATLLNKDATPKQITAAMAQYQLAQQTYSKRHKKAEAALEAKIGFNRNLKMKAALVIMGAIGDNVTPVDLKSLQATNANTDAKANPDAANSNDSASKNTPNSASKVGAEAISNAANKVSTTANDALGGVKDAPKGAADKVETPVKDAKDAIDKATIPIPH